jgi:hypothetical protein
MEEEMKGTLTGTCVCGYGERFVVTVPTLPKFKNHGLNVFISTNGVNEVELPEPLDVNHSSCDSAGYAKKNNRFMGWVSLSDGKRSTPVFLSAFYSVTPNVYAISG